MTSVPTFPQRAPGKTKRPCFSIITVCWNAQDSIRETGNSLAAQSFDDYEWLVVDGASSDGTLAEVERVAIPNKRVQSQPDAGIYDAMNKAIRLAEGEWLYFLNSGDQLHDSDVLQDIHAFVQTRPDSTLIFGNARYTGHGTSFIKRFSHINRWMLVFEDLNHQATFAHRTLFERIGDFKLEFRYSADYDWFLRVFRSDAKTHYIDRTLCRFLVGGAHSANLEKLGQERQGLRLQYVSRPSLWLGKRLAGIRRHYYEWRDAQLSKQEQLK
ncbi:glycosyltransferase family 2 protein [Rhodoferax mekongensis]|uniref:Glycosyltransferase family 2 protein n=1 Tax=Rhodoferax mekongensis TaxID=3068341 RepID=A0ABZ0B2V3_9BURK|nr:glycosyltransferase family 2 protein [Rhodoferax sp. TBRC 17307]WNO06253.1 glycosyltransferase family 2 protein [Rhodoferax sp. TBRC 17307]